MATKTQPHETMKCSSEAVLATAMVLSARGDNRQAEDILAKVLAAAPNLARGHHAMGIVKYRTGQHEAAIEHYRRAVKIDPAFDDACWNLALMLLRTGQLEEGYKHYEARWTTNNQKPDARTYDKPLWLGDEDIAGKVVFVWHEQGFGDFLQMARYIPLLAARAGKVYLEAHPAMANLMSDSMPENVELLEIWSEPFEYDYHLPFMSLPRAFRTSLATIPAATPYLRVGEDYLEKWAHILGPKTRPRIGITCSGAAAHTNDKNRSIPLMRMLELTFLDADIHLLQNEVREDDKRDLKHFHTHLEDIKDFSDTAALITNMDMVVSVDTSVAHLAGALGKPLYLLLPIAGDYRWMIDKKLSPWYPSARLFHQCKDGWWGLPIIEVTQTIKELLP